MRVPRLRLLALVLIPAVLAFASPATAARGGDTRAERDRVRRERAKVAAQLDVLRANGDEVKKALSALNERVAHEEAALTSAQQAVNVARGEAAAAAKREAETAAKIERLQATMRDAAISEFIRGGRGSDLQAVLSAKSIDLRELASVRALRDAVNSTAADVADALEAAREDFDVARGEAERAANVAERARNAADERLGQVRGARRQQQAFASELDQRIEERLSEAANLEAIDRDLAARLVREQQELARRASGIRRAGRSAVRRSGNIALATVRGITVRADIADQLQGLLEASDGPGLALGGGGYRDPSDQQRLREQNCPDPESSPAASCRPPTARPGESMHEEGLAIDFTSNGQLITSRRNPAYRWLANNAGRFGFSNLPEEPWHWSTNGR